MRRILCILGILCSLMILLFSGCDNPDFARYEFYEKDISYRIRGDVFIISQIEDEMLDIARKYCDGAKLTQVEYSLDSEVTGKLKFYYGFVDAGDTTVVMLELNLLSGLVERVIYEKGHSKRVSGPGVYVFNRDYDVRNVYRVVMNELSVKGVVTDADKISRVSITFVNDKIRLNCYDKRYKVLYGYEYSLLIDSN